MKKKLFISKLLIIILAIAFIISCGLGAESTKDTIIVFNAQISKNEVVGGSSQAAIANGSFKLNIDNGQLSGTVESSGLNPTAVHLHQGYAGEIGEKSVILEQDNTNTKKWHIPATTLLNSTEINNFQAGAYYVKAQYSNGVSLTHTRGQILSNKIKVYATDLIPADNIAGPGYGYTAVTLNTQTREAITKATITEQPAREITVGHVHDIQDYASISMTLNYESTTGGLQQFSSGLITLSAANMQQLQSGRLYINLHSNTAPNLVTELTGAFGYEENDIIVFNVSLSSSEVVTGDTDDSVRGTGQINVHRQTHIVSGYVTLYGLDFIMESIKLHNGFAGSEGDSVDSVAFSSADGINIQITENSLLTETQFEALIKGKLYLNVHYNYGALANVIRGQLLPPNIDLLVTRLTPPQPFTQTPNGFAAVTLNANDYSINVNAQMDLPVANPITAGRLKNHYDSNTVLLELTEDPRSITGNFWSFNGMIDETKFLTLKNSEIDIILFTGEPSSLQVEAVGTMSEHQDTLSITSHLNSREYLSFSKNQFQGDDEVSVDLHSREISATVTFPDNSTVNTLQLKEGYAGQAGNLVATLRSVGTSGWVLPDPTVLSLNQLNDLLKGKYFLYAQIIENTTLKEIRAQILPDNIKLYLASLEAPESSGELIGMAALTINTDTFDTFAIARAFSGTGTGIVVVAGHIHDTENPQVSIMDLSKSTSSKPNEIIWDTPQDSVLDLAALQSLEASEFFVHLHRSLIPLIVEMTGQFEPGQ